MAINKPTYTSKTTGGNIYASHVNDLQDAITNITTEIGGRTSTATAAGTTTLTSSSDYLQYFTGTTTQTVVLPVVSTLTLGRSFEIHNLSTGAITVQSSGGNAFSPTVATNKSAKFICILTSGTSTASWEYVSSGGASTLDDLEDVAATTPANAQIIQYNTSSSQWEKADNISGFTMIFGDGVNAVSTGYQRVAVSIPFNCTAVAWYTYLVGDTSVAAATCQFQLIRTTLANYPDTSLTYILGTSGTSVGLTNVIDTSESTTFNSTTLTQNDILRINVTGTPTAKQVALHVRVKRS